MANLFDSFMKKTNALLDDHVEKKAEIRQEYKKRIGCKNHPDRLIYMKGLCIECDAEDRQLKNRDRASREPWMSTNGFMFMYIPDQESPVLLHRWVAEQFLGRSLLKTEKIGFIDENPKNCEPDNLCITLKIPLTSLQQFQDLL